MENIHDKANELAAMIRRSEEYKEYIRIKDVVMAEESNKKMIADYKKLQFEAQAAYMSGKDVAPELLDKIKKLGEVLQFNPQITQYFSAEYRFNTLIADIYKIIGEACDVGLEFLEE